MLRRLRPVGNLMNTVLKALSGHGCERLMIAFRQAPRWLLPAGGRSDFRLTGASKSRTGKRACFSPWWLSRRYASPGSRHPLTIRPERRRRRSRSRMGAAGDAATGRELMSAADVGRTISRIAHQIIEKTALDGADAPRVVLLESYPRCHFGRPARREHRRLLRRRGPRCPGHHALPRRSDDQAASSAGDHVDTGRRHRCMTRRRPNKNQPWRRWTWPRIAGSTPSIRRFPTQSSTYFSAPFQFVPRLPDHATPLPCAGTSGD